MEINKRLSTFVMSIRTYKKHMEDKIEKLELHIVRLEQCIRQVQKLERMGLADDKVNERIDAYLDGISEARKRIDELKKQTQKDKD